MYNIFCELKSIVVLVSNSKFFRFNFIQTESISMILQFLIAILILGGIIAGVWYFKNRSSDFYGPPGPPGPQGPKGDPGRDGDRGPQGYNGPRGIPGLPGITGPPGRDGAEGAQGLRGPEGNPGIQGVAGPRGEQGAPGLPGAVGLTGPQGPAGPIGPPGKNGTNGAQGIPGAPGAKGDPGAPGVAGPQGPQGNPGATGATGQNGTKGDKGEKGDKGDKGTDGTDGKDGERGERGLPGAPGLRGPKGEDGVGVPGAPGQPGKKGDKGDPGLTGPIGPAGLNGTTGPQGVQGVQGKKGDKGDKGDFTSLENMNLIVQYFYEETKVLTLAQLFTNTANADIGLYSGRLNINADQLHDKPITQGTIYYNEPTTTCNYVKYIAASEILDGSIQCCVLLLKPSLFVSVGNLAIDFTNTERYMSCELSFNNRNLFLVFGSGSETTVQIYTNAIDRHQLGWPIWITGIFPVVQWKLPSYLKFSGFQFGKITNQYNFEKFDIIEHDNVSRAKYKMTI